MKKIGDRKVAAYFLVFILFAVTFSGLISVSKTVVAQGGVVEKEFEATLTTTPQEKPVTITVGHTDTNDGFGVIRGEPPFYITLNIQDMSPEYYPGVRLSLELISPSGRNLHGGGGYLGESAVSIYQEFGENWILTGEDVEELEGVTGWQISRSHAETGVYTFLIQQVMGSLTNLTDVLSPICSIEIELIDDDELPDPSLAPIASYTVSPESPVGGDTLEVDATGSSAPDGDIFQYWWTINGIEKEEIRGYSLWTWSSVPAGTYEIKLVVQDNNGVKSDPFIKTVVFVGGKTNEKPIASYTVSPEDPFEGDTLQFNASDSSDPDGQVWDYIWFINGTEDKDSRGKKTWLWSSVPAGTYVVKLVVEDDEWVTSEPCIIIVVVYGVEVNEKPVASFTVSPESPVEGDTLEVDASGSYDPDGEVFDYRWLFNGDEDTEIRGAQSWSWSDMPAGAYEITLVVVDDKGAESRAEMLITVKPVELNLRVVSVREFQVVERFFVLVADKRAGVRVTVRNDGSIILDNVKIRFEILDSNDNLNQVYQKETVTSMKKDEQSNFDFFFTLKQGRYVFKVTVDPLNEIAETNEDDNVLLSPDPPLFVEVVDTKHLHMVFIPVDIPNSLTNPKLYSFIKGQVDFIRDVYPLPESHVTFSETDTYSSRVKALGISPPGFNSIYKKQLVARIAARSFLDNPSKLVRYVGIVPANWWEEDVYGFAFLPGFPEPYSSGGQTLQDR